MIALKDRMMGRLMWVGENVHQVNKWFWLLLSGFVALVVATLLIATGWLTKPTAFAVADGSVLTNAEGLLVTAEVAHRASLAGVEVDVLTPVGEEEAICYLVLVGETLTDDLACGVTRYPEQELGGYDTMKVTFESSDLGVTGSIAETVSWTKGGSLPAGATLVRPDGKQALSGDLLKRPVVPAEVLPETATETVYLDRYLPGEVITEYLTESVEVFVPTTPEPIVVEKVTLLETVTDSSGGVFKAGTGERLVAVEIGGDLDDGKAAWFLDVDGDRSPLELQDGSGVLRVPAASTVLLVGVLDGVETVIEIVGDQAGTITVPEELEELYPGETAGYSWSQDSSRFKAKEATRAEVSGLASIKHKVWDEELGFGVTSVVLSSMDNICLADNLGDYIYSPSRADEPYDFSTVTLRADGVDAGAPDASSTVDGVTVLSWVTGNVSEVEFAPAVTLTCEGAFMFRGGESYPSYEWAVPEALTGVITATKVYEEATTGMESEPGEGTGQETGDGGPPVTRPTDAPGSN